MNEKSKEWIHLLFYKFEKMLPCYGGTLDKYFVESLHRICQSHPSSAIDILENILIGFLHVKICCWDYRHIVIKTHKIVLDLTMDCIKNLNCIEPYSSKLIPILTSLYSYCSAYDIEVSSIQNILFYLNSNVHDTLHKYILNKIDSCNYHSIDFIEYMTNMFINLDINKLIRFIEDLNLRMKFMKKEQQIINIYFMGKIIIEWIHYNYNEYNVLQSSPNNQLTSVCDQLFMELQLLSENMKKKAEIWCLQITLLILCPNILEEVVNLESGAPISPENLKKKQFIDVLKKCLNSHGISKTLLDSALITCVRLWQVGTFVNFNHTQNPIFSLIKSTTHDLKIHLFNRSHPYIRGQMFIQSNDVELLVNFFISFYRLNPHNTDILNFCVQPESHSIYHYVLFKALNQIADQQKVNPPWWPKIDILYYKSNEIRNLLVEIITKATQQYSVTSGNRFSTSIKDKVTTLKFRDKPDEFPTLKLTLQQAFTLIAQCPLLFIQFQTNLIGIRELIYGLTSIIFLDSMKDLTREALVSLSTLLDPKLYSGTTGLPDTFSKFYGIMFVTILTIAQKLIARREMSNYGQLFVWICSVIQTRLNFLKTVCEGEIDLNGQLGSVEGLKPSVPVILQILEILAYSHIYDTDVEVVCGALNLFGYLSEEYSLLGINEIRGGTSFPNQKIYHGGPDLAFNLRKILEDGQNFEKMRNFLAKNFLRHVRYATKYTSIAWKELYDRWENLIHPILETVNSIPFLPDDSLTIVPSSPLKKHDNTPRGSSGGGDYGDKISTTPRGYRLRQRMHEFDCPFYPSSHIPMEDVNSNNESDGDFISTNHLNVMYQNWLNLTNLIINTCHLNMVDGEGSSSSVRKEKLSFDSNYHRKNSFSTNLDAMISPTDTFLENLFIILCFETVAVPSWFNENLLEILCRGIDHSLSIPIFNQLANLVLHLPLTNETALSDSHLRIATVTIHIITFLIDGDYDLGKVYIEDLILKIFNFLRYLDLTVDRFRSIAINASKMVQKIMDKRDHLILRQEIRFRNNLIDHLVNLLLIDFGNKLPDKSSETDKTFLLNQSKDNSLFLNKGINTFASNSDNNILNFSPEETFVKDSYAFYIIECLQAFSACVEELPLQSNEVNLIDSIGAKSQLFQKYFTTIINTVWDVLLSTTSIAAVNRPGPSQYTSFLDGEGGGAEKNNCFVKLLLLHPVCSTVYGAAVDAAAKLLTANMEIGLVQCIGLGYYFHVSTPDSHVKEEGEVKFRQETTPPSPRPHNPLLCPTAITRRKEGSTTSAAFGNVPVTESPLSVVTRMAFLDVMTKVLRNQGAKFDNLADSAIGCYGKRLAKLIDLITVISDEGDLPLVAALVNVCVSSPQKLPFFFIPRPPASLGFPPVELAPPSTFQPPGMSAGRIFTSDFLLRDQLDVLAYVLIDVFERKHLLYQLYWTVFTCFTKGSGSIAETTLAALRDNDFVAKLIGTSFKMFGAPYLKTILGPVLQELWEQFVNFPSLTLEIDPLKLGPQPIKDIKREIIKANVEEIKCYALKIFEALLRSVHQVPAQLRIMCHCLKQTLLGSDPEDARGVSTFFLRYVNPAVMNARENGLICGGGGDNLQAAVEGFKRALFLVVKVLQKLSNRTLFTETHMDPFNDFLRKHSPRCLGYFNEICYCHAQQQPGAGPTLAEDEENNLFAPNIVVIDNGDLNVTYLHKLFWVHQNTISDYLINATNTTPRLNEDPYYLMVIDRKPFDKLFALLGYLGPPDPSKLLGGFGASANSWNCWYPPPASAITDKDIAVIDNLLLRFGEGGGAGGKNVGEESARLKTLDVFYHSGYSLDNDPVFYYVARRYCYLDMNGDALLFTIFSTLKPFLGKPFDLIIDLTNARNENRLRTDTLFKLLHLPPPNTIFTNLKRVFVYNANSWTKTFTKYHEDKLLKSCRNSPKVHFIESFDALNLYVNVKHIKIPTMHSQLSPDRRNTPDVKVYPNTYKMAAYKDSRVTLTIGTDVLSVIHHPHNTSSDKFKILGYPCPVLHDVYFAPEIEEVALREENQFTVTLTHESEPLCFIHPESSTIVKLLIYMRTCVGRRRENNMVQQPQPPPLYRSSGNSYLLQHDTKNQQLGSWSPKDLPGTLLNMALLNLNSRNGQLRCVAFQLYRALCDRFDFVVLEDDAIAHHNVTSPSPYIPSLAAQGGEGNALKNFTRSLSKNLATGEPHLTLDFLEESLLHSYNCLSTPMRAACLSYVVPWLSNLDRFLKKDERNKARVIDILDKLLTISTTTSSIAVMDELWKGLKPASAPMFEIILDLHVKNHHHALTTTTTSLLNNHNNTFQYGLSTSSFLNFISLNPGLLFKRLLQRLLNLVESLSLLSIPIIGSALSNLSSPKVSTATRYLNEISLLLRYTLSLTFYHNHKGRKDGLNMTDDGNASILPLIFQIVALLAGCGDTVFNATVFGIFVNTLHFILNYCSSSFQNQTGNSGGYYENPAFNKSTTFKKHVTEFLLSLGGEEFCSITKIVFGLDGNVAKKWFLLLIDHVDGERDEIVALEKLISALNGRENRTQFASGGSSIQALPLGRVVLNPPTSYASNTIHGLNTYAAFIAKCAYTLQSFHQECFLLNVPLQPDYRIHWLSLNQVFMNNPHPVFQPRAVSINSVLKINSFYNNGGHHPSIKPTTLSDVRVHVDLLVHALTVFDRSPGLAISVALALSRYVNEENPTCFNGGNLSSVTPTTTNTKTNTSCCALLFWIGIGLMETEDTDLYACGLDLLEGTIERTVATCSSGTAGEISRRRCCDKLDYTVFTSIIHSNEYGNGTEWYYFKQADQNVGISFRKNFNFALTALLIKGYRHPDPEVVSKTVKVMSRLAYLMRGDTADEVPYQPTRAINLDNLPYVLALLPVTQSLCIVEQPKPPGNEGRGQRSTLRAHSSDDDYAKAKLIGYDDNLFQSCLSTNLAATTTGGLERASKCDHVNHQPLHTVSVPFQLNSMCQRYNSDTDGDDNENSSSSDCGMMRRCHSTFSIPTRFSTAPSLRSRFYQDFCCNRIRGQKTFKRVLLPSPNLNASCSPIISRNRSSSLVSTSSNDSCCGGEDGNAINFNLDKFFFGNDGVKESNQVLPCLLEGNASSQALVMVLLVTLLRLDEFYEGAASTIGGLENYPFFKLGSADDHKTRQNYHNKIHRNMVYKYLARAASLWPNMYPVIFNYLDGKQLIAFACSTSEAAGEETELQKEDQKVGFTSLEALISKAIVTTNSSRRKRRTCDETSRKIPLPSTSPPPAKSPTYNFSFLISIGFNGFWTFSSPFNQNNRLNSFQTETLINCIEAMKNFIWNSPEKYIMSRSYDNFKESLNDSYQSTLTVSSLKDTTEFGNQN